MPTLVYIEPKAMETVSAVPAGLNKSIDHRGPMQISRGGVVDRLPEQDTGACLGIYLRNRVLDGRRIATVS